MWKRHKPSPPEALRNAAALLKRGFLSEGGRGVPARDAHGYGVDPRSRRARYWAPDGAIAVATGGDTNLYWVVLTHVNALCGECGIISFAQGSQNADLVIAKFLEAADRIDNGEPPTAKWERMHGPHCAI